MSDPDRLRPALPDPQQDRHVSFPDDAPDGAPDLGPAPSGPAPSGPALPPEAWASRPAGRDPSWHEPSAWSAPTLTTPPARPAPRRRRPGWRVLMLVPALMFVLAHGQTDAPTTDGCPSYTGAGPGMSDCGAWDGTSDGGIGAPADSVPGVWTEDVTATTTFAPMLGGKPKVSPVPVGAAALRVEIVSAAGPAATADVEAQVDTTVGDSPIDAWLGSTPHALEVHLAERPTGLKISATVTSGSGAVQCRVYADSLLVAVDTSDSMATCQPQM